MKKPHKYGYFKVENLHKYRYFGIEEPHGYKYLIVKKLDRNIQDRHSFQILVIVDKLVYEQADYILEEPCV